VLLAVWWSGVALVLLVRSLWYVVAQELGWASFPSPQPSPPRGEGVDPVLLAVRWSGVALVLSVRSLWYVVAEELGWASFPSPQPSPPRGEGVDSVLLLVCGLTLFSYRRRREFGVWLMAMRELRRCPDPRARAEPVPSP